MQIILIIIIEYRSKYRHGSLISRAYGTLQEVPNRVYLKSIRLLY